MKQLSIRAKITGLIFIIIGFSLFLAGIVIISNFVQSQEAELKGKALQTAKTIANLPYIATAIDTDRNGINSKVESLRMIYRANYIVVMDMQKVRLSHPVNRLIGKKSSGTDENPAFAELTYTSKAKGELGTVIRAFAPIINEQHQQVGVVLVGYLLPTFIELIWNLRMEIFLTAAFSLFFGGWGSWLLASHIKKEMFDLEPHEIAALVVERTQTFNAIHEGIIAIDKDENITIFNDKAKAMMGIQGDVIGKKIRTVLPDTRLPEILQLNQGVYNKELTVRSSNIVSNRIPIKIQEQTVGAVAIFQERTDVTRLAEELTGVRAFVSALRVQNHEHMNKLHTIAGLLQLGHKDQALNYVFDITEEQAELTRFLSDHIKSDNLSGLLLSKVARGKELGIHVHIDRHSRLDSFPKPLDHHDFVVILGNLIENSFDAFKFVHTGEKEIYVSIVQTDKTLSILVEDNGPGMSPETIPSIFTEGYSTKQGDNRGIGLYLIKEKVDKANGDIQVESALGDGTSFIITFYLSEGDR